MLVPQKGRGLVFSPLFSHQNINRDRQTYTRRPTQVPDQYRKTRRASTQTPTRQQTRKSGFRGGPRGGGQTQITPPLSSKLTSAAVTFPLPQVASARTAFWNLPHTSTHVPRALDNIGTMLWQQSGGASCVKLAITFRLSKLFFA